RDEVPQGTTRKWARQLAWIALPIAIGAFAVARYAWPDDEAGGARAGRGDRARGPVPVEVAPIVVGPVEESRVFTATLEPSARIVVAAEVAGTVGTIHADLADEV